jgi:hypothetical protein
MPDAPITRGEAYDRMLRAQERVAAAELLASAARDELARAEAALGEALPDSSARADVPIVVSADARIDARESLRAEPADWRHRRTTTTWAVVGVALVASLLMHWIAQMIAGAVVGASVGLDGLANITARDLDAVQVMTLASTLILTTVAIGWSGLVSYERLSWPPASGDYGMRWWRYCFAPVLGLTAVHALVFAVLLSDAARP